MANIKDVAQAAGVSIGTVSNVLNGTKPVSGEVRTKVLEAVETLKYQKNPAASSLKSRKTYNIGVVFTSLTGIFFPEVLRGIQTEALAHDYSVSVYDVHEDPAYERSLIPRLASSWVDGLIIASFTSSDGAENAKYWNSLHNLRNRNKALPVVNIEWRAPYAQNDAVIIDQKEAAKTAIRHLIACGHRRIAHICGPRCSEIVRLRCEGYAEAMKEAGLDWKLDWLRECNYAPLSGYNSMRELMMQGEITAVFCGNDQMAIGAVRAIKEQGLSIPEDIAVIGFDNLFAGTLITPSLSTINVPRYQMGTVAMQLLQKRIEDPEYAGQQIVELPTRLVVRRSTDVRGDNTWELFGW